MNRDKIQVGDVLAFMPPVTDVVGNLINWFSWGGGYCHVAIVTDRTKHSIIVTESNCDKQPYGVRMRELRYNERFHVYRLDSRPLSQLVVQACDDKIGLPYDALAFPSTWLRSVLCRAFGWAHYRKTPTLIQDRNGYYCSELIATAFYEVFEIEIVDGLHHTAVTPNDLVGRKSKLKRAF